MLTRSQNIKRRLKRRLRLSSSRPHYRKPQKKTPVLRTDRLKPILLEAVVGVVFIALLWVGWRIIRPGEKVRANAETVAAFRVPYRSIGLLKEYSARQGVPFSQVFTLFCAENAFFPEKAAAYDLSFLERQYVVSFDKLKRKYDTNSIQPYYDLFKTLFDEIIYFPIPDGFDTEASPSYMYGDSWGVTRNFENDKTHKGADIMDRENIRGRIPVVSMTDGVVQDVGWHNELGYYTGIVTSGGTYYLYAHLNSLHAQVTEGARIAAGQILGSMGDSGSGREGTTGRFQVHLHIGISPNAGFTRQAFWINPYPLLRYIEETKTDIANVASF